MGQDEPGMQIAPRGAGWPDPRLMDLRISEWETAAGKALPKDYRRFMTKYDGGRIYPAMFDVTVPAPVWHSSAVATFADPFLTWDEALSRWNGEPFGVTTPGDMFFFAQDGFGLNLLLSLRPSDHGAVYSWLGAQVAWGEPGNDVANLYLQAPSFSVFLTQLYDTPQRDAWKFWHRPRYDGLAQPLILD